MTEFQSGHELVRSLRAIVGRKHVLTNARATHSYRHGFRFGSGNALAVVRPGTLLEQWRVLQTCVKADVIVLMQAANTGLTGGSTPAGSYDRDVVIVSTKRITGVFLIDGARQVICLPGTTLHVLECTLRRFGREPHSVIGSSCIGASVVGGVCNNSGGALIRRGPAYTQMALFAQVDACGELRLVNHLGISLGEEAEVILERLQSGSFEATDIGEGHARASDPDYIGHVRDVDANSPARFNADPRRLFEASGSAGKVVVFAVRLDTFAAEPDAKVFYVGCNDPASLEDLRRAILTTCISVPIAGEYIHRAAFDLADHYGKDQFLLIDWLGTDRIPRLFDLKGRFDACLSRLGWLPANLSDRLLFVLGRLWPDHLPKRLRLWRQLFEHHLILKVSADAAQEMRGLLQRWSSGEGNHFECTLDEANKAFLHRFVVAGAAVRYRAIHPTEVAGIIALDVALRRNDRSWFEHLPADLERRLVGKIYYGHFLCHVFHQDYIVAKGEDLEDLEHCMWTLMDRRGARYPAEHNVGQIYPADAALADFYEALDPGNRFNPGIGLTSKNRDYRRGCVISGNAPRHTSGKEPAS